MEKVYPIKFNKSELSGAFGDIGTDLPLIIAMILAANLYVPGALIMFGVMQVFTGWVYRMPMPAQPLKAMATLVIAQQIGGNILLGAGLAIGLVMLVLSVTGLLGKIASWVPKVVVRGLQLGLGISLCSLAFKNYISSDSINGYILAGISFVLILIFIDNKRYPVSLLVIALGMVYAFVFKIDAAEVPKALGFSLPAMGVPSVEDITKGFLLLALPQIPLSLGNSIIATRQVAQDLFPERKGLSIKKIGITYSIMNLVNPFFGGIPTCHGSGGMVGHYAFGGRTGGSVIIYGSMYIILGLFLASGFHNLVQAFPLPVLGVILMVEGISLSSLIKDVAGDRKGFIITLLVGVIAFGLPYGFVVSLVVGTVVYYLPLSLNALSNLGSKKPPAS
ncbi:MAG TPA: putative sulfate/molybdate transporter [Cyclobacteriaceae bacterium]|nr:putative sulfate/molybdate transporter [Cyclobacteriaceae bacterium]MCB9237925.1 transporter [Flammeovirgaceae bacterium]MCB0499235.1 putative sulfate/molybdate transporter [Cyclobacteriaceae bacterium]MCO5271924.1 putative sulfate/molybdate transporter [Cyclobacteriaceae bacterium]MCW5902470.1 putative sulfate/molybdate transporter [Cyclobacteriaceae bacterium]